jgi:hypothetical protein
LRRLVKELGVLVLVVPGCALRLHTTTLPHDSGKGPHRQYGADLTTRLASSHPDFRIVLVIGTDPVTLAREWIYLLSHDQRKLDLIVDRLAKVDHMAPIPII